MANGNTLSNLAKRQIAFSGQAGTGDIPDLYALRRAMARESEAQMGGTPSLGAGEGAGAPIPTAAGGGGGGAAAVGGAADTGLPGQGFADPQIERMYTRAFRALPTPSGEAPDRGEIASRGALNIDPADPFGVGFGQNLATTTQIGSILGLPFMGMANSFVNLMLQDAQMRSDQFFDSLIEGTAPLDYSSGVAIRRSPEFESDFGAGAGSDFGADLATGNVDVQPGSGVSISRGRGRGSGSGGGRDTSPDIGGGYGQETLGGPSHSDTLGDSGFGGGGDAGSGGGGGGAGTGGCFVAGTKITMSDGSEKPIEDVHLGDKVLAFDADTGETDACEVISRFSHVRHSIWVLNDRTFCTPIHRFWAKFGANGWGFWPLEEIPIGAWLMDAAGNEIAAETIQDTGRLQTVHNIEVERLHTYIADGYRVHNEKHEGGYIDESRVPDVTRGDVDEILQEGEFVVTADAVDMIGPEFFEGINRIARLARKAR